MPEATCHAAAHAAPCHPPLRSAEDLRRALREGRGRPVELDVGALNRVLHADAAHRRIEVQGATRWRDLASWLGTAGMPLAAWAARAESPLTVADAIHEDLPGPDGRPMAAYVESVALFTVDGELRRADRDRDARLFRHVVAGQGVFGMLYSVVLRGAALLGAADAAPRPISLELAPATPGAHALVLDVLVPPQCAEASVQQTRTIAAELRINLQRMTVRRLLGAPEAALSTPTGAWAGITVRYDSGRATDRGAPCSEFAERLLAEAIACGGTFPAHAACAASRSQLTARHAALPGFLEEKRRVDPAERLQNAWYRAVTARLRQAAAAEG